VQELSKWSKVTLASSAAWTAWTACNFMTHRCGWCDDGSGTGSGKCSEGNEIKRVPSLYCSDDIYMTGESNIYYFWLD